MTVDEGRAALATARDLFALGNWDDLYETLLPVHEAKCLEGTELGEVAFYLGEACLGRGQPDLAAPYLEEAYRLADTDFAAWAEEEWARARQLLGGGDQGDAPAAADDAAPVPAAADDTARVPAAASWPMLRRGSPEREWVAHAQAKLAHLGHYRLTIDGLFGPGTDAAVREFQELWSLKVDGIIGPVTWPTLDAAAPGITGVPEVVVVGGGGHAGQSGDSGQQPGPHTVPEVVVEGDPTAVTADTWEPEVPDLRPGATGAVEPPVVGGGGEVEGGYKIPIGKSLGPVTLKELPVKFSGKLSSAKGEYADVTATLKGIKVDPSSWKFFDGDDWDASLKGSLAVGSESGISGSVEVTNGVAVFEVKFTFVKVAKGEWDFAELSGSAGLTLQETFEVDGHTVVFSGKATVGATLEPNWAWFAGEGAKVAAQVAATEAIPTGAAAVGAGEAIVATGFLAAAVATIYVAYRNMTDIQSLKQLQTDADKAVDDFAAGFVSAWGAGSAPGGEWGAMGASAGSRQFEADLRAFERQSLERHPDLVIDEDFREEVRQLWRSTAADKASGFRSVIVKMFGKMVRTAIYIRWRKANEDYSLPGDIDRTAQLYSGIQDGPSYHPDIRAAHEAAQSANMQLNIDSWHEWENE